MTAIAYPHVVSALRLELARRPSIRLPAILDAGCGRGELLRLVGDCVESVRAGFDSPAYGLQGAEMVGSVAGPGVDVRLTNADGSWPFDDDSFDVVLSNQVCEHVVDLQHFCSENARVLRPGGFAIHVFPLRNCIVEPHMHIPLVHKLRDHDLRMWAIGHLSKVGIGVYRTQGPPVGVAADEFARAHADYLRTFTTYRTWKQVSDEFHRQGFRVTRRYTAMLLQRALLRLFKRPGGGRPLSPVWEALLFPFTRAIASVTIVVEAEQDYRFDWKEIGSAGGVPAC